MSSNTKKQPKRIEVYFVFEEPGYCRKYYRTLPNHQLVCYQEPEGWYTVIEDGCWNEPNSSVDEDKFDLVIVEKPEPKKETDEHEN